MLTRAATPFLIGTLLLPAVLRADGSGANRAGIELWPRLEQRESGRLEALTGKLGEEALLLLARAPIDESVDDRERCEHRRRLTDELRTQLQISENLERSGDGARDEQPRAEPHQPREHAQACSASTLAAQRKSFSDRPPTSCVDQRMRQ